MKNKNHICAFYSEDCRLCNPNKKMTLKDWAGALALMAIAYVLIVLLESTFK